jgi:hypothetical protein
LWGKILVSREIKSTMILIGIWGPLEKLYSGFLGQKNIWRLNEFRRARFLSLSRHTETLVTELELKKLISSLKPVKTEFDLIRIGDSEDGGYLVPDLLETIRYAFSPGVAGTASFERDLISRGIFCYLADYSVDTTPISGNFLDFDKKFIGIEDNEVFMTLSTWLDAKCINSNDLLLQMDIEGAEWEVLESVDRETLLKFKVLVIEFHNLHFLLFKYSFESMKRVVDSLLSDYYVVHFHPNNNDGLQNLSGVSVPPTAEITFLRKDSCKRIGLLERITSPLDSHNSNWKRHIYAEDIFSTRNIGT